MIEFDLYEGHTVRVELGRAVVIARCECGEVLDVAIHGPSQAEREAAVRAMTNDLMGHLQQASGLSAVQLLFNKLEDVRVEGLLDGEGEGR